MDTPQQALRLSEDRFRGMFENASIGIAILDAEGWFQRVNPTYARMLCSTPEALVGRHVTEVTHPDDQAYQHDMHVRLLSGELDTYSMDKRYRLADGRVRWGSISVSAVRDEKGQVLSIIGIKQDITEQREATQQLAEGNTLRELAGVLGRIGGWTVSLPDLAVHWSDVVCEICEMPAGTSPTREVGFGLASPEVRPTLESAFARCAADGTPFDLELPMLTAKGSKRWVRIIGQPHHATDGSIDAIQGALQDQTEKKALELQFLRAQRLESVGVLAGGIAHDLNNVLTPILMSIDLLRMNETDQERLAVIAGVEASARRGADMVRQVLTFARGAEGRRMTVQVRHLVHEVEKIIRDAFHKNITLRSDVPSGLAPVTGDPTQLHQVLVNLCVNARDAMPNGGTLGVSLREEMVSEQEAAPFAGATAGKHIVIEVMDTGTGIAAGQLEHIFDPFFTTKEPGKGTGLGLSTSVAIVKSHGGFITVATEIGTGTTFRVFLPASSEGHAEPCDVPATAIPRGLGELVLVVDDEPAVRAVTKRSLERLGYRAIVAGDGAEAISRFAAHRHEVKVVVTDMMMPVMDGATLIEMLVRMEPKVRIIAASGVIQQLQDVHARSGEENVRAFLNKPYTTEMLVSAIREAIRACPAAPSYVETGRREARGRW